MDRFRTTALWGRSSRFMPVYEIPEEIVFPPPGDAEPSGLLGVGGDLRPERLLQAYAMGIFPWYEDPDPILWFSPDPRAVLIPNALRAGRTLRRSVRRFGYAVSMDTDFSAVVSTCAATERPGQDGTWITTDMVAAYTELHRLGFAHSVEVRDGPDLVGGLYGVSLGASFFGESMFSRSADASKVALVWLARQLEAWSFSMIDCQVPSPHLEGLGVQTWPRTRFLETLRASLTQPTRQGCWSFDDGFAPLEMEES